MEFDFSPLKRIRRLHLAIMAGVVCIPVLAGFAFLSGGSKDPRAAVGSEEYAAYLACLHYVSSDLGVTEQELDSWSTFRVETPYDETRLEMTVRSWVVMPRKIGGDLAYEYDCNVKKADGQWLLTDGGLKIVRVEKND